MVGDTASPSFWATAQVVVLPKGAGITMRSRVRGATRCKQRAVHSFPLRTGRFYRLVSMEGRVSFLPYLASGSPACSTVIGVEMPAEVRVSWALRASLLLLGWMVSFTS